VSINQTAMSDVPVLPRFSYDITARNDAGDPLVVKSAILVGSNYTTIDSYEPKVSMIITRETPTEQPTFPGGIDLWYPDNIFSHSSIEEEGEDRNYLQVTPAQYYTETGNGLEGTMRLYETVTLRVLYVDPAVVGAAEALADTVPPIIEQVRVVKEGPNLPAGMIRLLVEVSEDRDTDTGVAKEGVQVSYTSNNAQQQEWETHILRRRLLANNTEAWTVDISSADVPQETRCSPVQFTISARDNAGNVSFYNGKGTMSAPHTEAVAVEEVSITGPTEGTLSGDQMTRAAPSTVGSTYTFTATVTPADATTPISYTWSPEPTAGQGSAHAEYAFTATGSYSITVSASNIWNDTPVSSASPHTISITQSQTQQNQKLYLPWVRR
jgi:hypothetical protein